MAKVSRQEVEAALGSAREELAKHGGNVELMGVNDQGVVLVRLMGACSGCPSANVTLKEIIEKSLKEKLPAIERVEAMM
ncbi:MAG: NifU family protein [Desulfarculaceae bacterium]|nr:NifU family protein [Desulfarculaceae bacterium]MCF8073437.1 NifU family protein [Desulfarculaceae bacterium]MCF8100416.1 NifU family protein [Desulfarculaceae bacterium]MCF8115848.1 NifU family protein [Desulfarculaceae bacterium]